MKITVIGCGSGAFATAADLTERGHEVTMFVDAPHQHNFDAIRETKTIKCFGVGPQGPVTIHDVTDDVEKAVRWADLIVPVVPSNAHVDVARSVAPYIESGDKIFVNPGSTGGALVFAKVLRDCGRIDGVKIAEVHTLPYTARRVGDDGVSITLLATMMYFAAFPASCNQEMHDLIAPMYPNIFPVSDVLETGLNNGNATTHPAPVVLNAGKIEYYGRNKQFEEGITPSVGNVIQLLDDERKDICRAFGYAEVDIKDRLVRMGYVQPRPTVYECIQTSVDIYLPLEGPNDLNHRFLVEDVPYSLVGMINVARVAGIRAPLMESVVRLAGALKGVDYFAEGRTLEELGIEGMTMSEISEYLQTGKY